MKRRKHAALRGRQMFLQLSDWCRRCQYFITMTKDLKFLFPKCPLQSKWSPQRRAAYLKWPEKQPLTSRVRCKDDVRPQKRFVFSCDEQLLFFWWLLNPWEQHSKPFSLVWMTSCWIIQTSLRLTSVNITYYSWFLYVPFAPVRWHCITTCYWMKEEETRVHGLYACQW